MFKISSHRRYDGKDEQNKNADDPVMDPLLLWRIQNSAFYKQKVRKPTHNLGELWEIPKPKTPMRKFNEMLLDPVMGVLLQETSLPFEQDERMVALHIQQTFL